MCNPNKIEDVNLNVLKMITGNQRIKGINKNISCDCKCKFDARKCKSNQNGMVIRINLSVKNQ